MLKISIFALFLFSIVLGMAQKEMIQPVEIPEPEVVKTTEEPIYQIVEQEASFLGGNEELKKWIVAHIQYPPYCKENGIEGKVYLSFVVEKDGSLSNFKIRRGVHKLLDSEALRLVHVMPNWIPGKINGEAVRQEFTMPIQFKLL